jgi:anti-sigma regulatory factor (Ser/Thr protein kinase)
VSSARAGSEGVGMSGRERRILAPATGSVRAGRHFVADVLTRWQLDDHLETATLLASEVMANAVLHADTTCIVDLSVDPDRHELLVAVTDFGRRPVLSPIAAYGLRLLLEEPDLDAESGRGLMIVASLADRWGIDPEPEGNTVWFALSLSPTGAGSRAPAAAR